MRFLSSSVICFAMSAFLSLRLPSSPDRARGRQEAVGAHDTEQPGFAKVNAPPSLGKVMGFVIIPPLSA